MKYVLLNILLLCGILNTALLNSQDSSYIYTTILTIADFNDDHTMDTLIGQSNFIQKYFPKKNNLG